MTPLNNGSTEYINSTDYKTLTHKLDTLLSVLSDLSLKSTASRKLRYAEVDIEAEKEAGRFQPDEVYVPQHIIDSNVRQEQSSYVQYITQSPRAVILKDRQDNKIDLSLLESDLTDKLRFDGWQLGMYANIDGFQANGYSIMEVVQDQSLPGEVGHEMVQLGDFAFISDTRDIQAVEMTARTYYYTKTRLMELCNPEMMAEGDLWSAEQVNKIIAKEPTSNPLDSGTDSRDKSLYKVHKIMYRIKGVVHVAWTSIGECDDWARKPRPLFIGRRELVQENLAQKAIRLLKQSPPPSKEAFETQYPYFLYPYLISENDTISHLKGRVYLDQDTQEAVTSILSSTCTQARRAAGMYFSKEVSDPNDDIMLQKNIFFKSGCIINSKVQAFKLDAPDPGIFTAIQMLVAGNKAETSQVSFAERNKQNDSRKTSAAVKSADKKEQQLSTVQVVLFSIALRQQYTYMCDIIKSRVLAGLIEVNPQVRPQYDRTWAVKPSGDVDVLEKEKLISMMIETWPVIQSTACAPLFLSDLLEKMFPDQAPKYIQVLQQAAQQAQSAQAQQMQQMMVGVQQMADGVIELSKHKDYFSDVGQLHAYPIVQQTARQLELMQQQTKQKATAQ